MRLSAAVLAIVAVATTLPVVLAQGRPTLRRVNEETSDNGSIATVTINRAATIKQTAMDLILPSGFDTVDGGEKIGYENDFSAPTLWENPAGFVKATMLDLMPQVGTDAEAPMLDRLLMEDTLIPTPAPVAPEPTVLENGVASEAVDVPYLGFQSYTFEVSDPTNPGTVTCRTNANLAGDADLYLRWGEYPKVGRAGDHDCLAVRWFVTRETCTVDIEDNTLYVVVLGWFPVKNLSVTCEENLVSPTPAPTPTPAEILTSGVESSVTASIPWLRAEVYTLDVSPTATSVTCRTNAALIGDLDLYLRWDRNPTIGRAGTHDCLSVRWFITRETCTVDVEGSTLHVVVFAWFPLRNVSVTCVEEGPDRLRRELSFE